jgi:menaquinone-specific isochorismate synthase
VLNFITQRLCQLGLLPQILAPRLRQLSNIQHLWTPISAVVPANIHPLKIVAQLHPTPAVAGAARDVACAEIRRYENFERGLYAAPLGWIDAKGNCEFIVGIRSALIDGDRARLYAGAGIVAGSDPDKEFAEVQLKLQALLKALV